MKRQHSEEEEEEVSKEAKMDSDTGKDGAKEAKGAPMFPLDRPLKLRNSNKLTFTKHFYFKIYANDWIYTQVGTAALPGADITGFMTVIPWQALCMYLSPNEYLDIVRQSNYASIEHSAFELTFKAARTPFDANSSDLAEANGNLQFQICRWDGLEQMMPFKVGDVSQDGTTKLYTSHQELINRLYGPESFYQEQNQWPACMRERGLSWRPIWNFRGDSTPTGNGSMYRNMNRAISALPIGEYVTDCLNTNQVKMGEGYSFNKTYKPKNGVITMAPSAYNKFNNMTGKTRINQPVRMQDVDLATIESKDDHQYEALFPTLDSGTNVVTGITTQSLPAVWFDPGVNHVSGNDGNPNIMTQRGPVRPDGTGNYYVPATDTLEPGAHPNQNFAWYWETEDVNKFAVRGYVTTVTPETAEAQEVTEIDNFGYGYSNDMAYYSIANLENHTMHTSRNQPPIHHMPSMLIGAIPKTTKQDNTIVNATFEFECRTQIVIEVQNVHPTYMNNSYLPFNDVDIPTGWADGRFATQDLYGGRWQHNETDVLLCDRLKHWNKSYGLAAKPLFEEMPANTPLL